MKCMIVDMDKLINRGLFRLPHAPSADAVQTAAEHKTVVVLSPPRACSSLVAGVLRSLGVFMGDSADDVVFEDNELARAMESGQTDRAEELIRAYDSRHRIWGFKRPAALAYVHELLPRLTNPHLIFVFRDVLTTALRDRIAANVDVLKTMEHLLTLQAEMIQILRSVAYPTLLVSAEKIREYRKEFVAEVCAFLQLQCAPEQVRSAEDSIEPVPVRYVNEARNNRVRGHIDVLERQRIVGWVRLVAKETPCKMILKVNGAVRKQCLADLHRPDLFALGAHATGKCGFQMTLADSESLAADDHIQLLTEEDPFTYLFAGKLAEWQRTPGGKNG
jgi:hypothetical protein